MASVAETIINENSRRKQKAVRHYYPLFQLLVRLAGLPARFAICYLTYLPTRPIVLLVNPTMSPVAKISALGFAFLTILMAGAAEKPLGIPKNSPFMPPAGSAPATTAANETLEFAGVLVSSGGKKTDLIFYDKTAKKSHWIAKGETKDGIAVLNYDERRDQVVIKVNGVEKTLQLRKGTGTVGTPQPVAPVPVGFNVAPAVQPLPTTPAMLATPAPTPTVVLNSLPAPPPAPMATPKPEGPVTPEVRAKQETEARMLVSDLLEIGMAQRKAYEEAQRRAAQGPAQPTAQPAPSPGTPAPQNP